jgi:small subunit ribosomal protein S6
MPYYENVFIARQDISSAQVDALADAFSEIITGAGGQIHRREYWGLKSLQYRIKKNRKGHFVLMNIEAASDAMQEMERLMRLNEDVMRHITIRTEEIPEGPSVMMQGRGDRERASRDGDDRPPRDSQARDSQARESQPRESQPRESQAPKADAPAAEAPAAEAPAAEETPAEKGDRE